MVPAEKPGVSSSCAGHWSVRELVFPQQTLACGWTWALWGFALAKCRTTPEIPSQFWILLQTMEVEWTQLVSSKERQGFSQIPLFLQTQCPAGCSAQQRVLWNALPASSNLLPQVRLQEPFLPSSEMTACFQGNLHRGERELNGEATGHRVVLI